MKSLTEREENWLAGTCCISSGVLTMKDSTSKIPVTKSTGDTRPEKEDTWTLRNTVIFLSMCLVYFALFAAYSVYAPFLPSEVSKSIFPIGYKNAKLIATSLMQRLKYICCTR